MSTNPVTIGDLIHAAKLLWCYCRACGHERDIDPATLEVEPSQPVPTLGQRMTCSKCGSHEITTAPELYPGGIVAQRKRFQGGD